MPARIHVDDLSFLGHRFKEARERLELSRVELVREAGYKNTNKGCRRIRHIERGDPPLADVRVLRRFAHVLELDLEALWRAVRQRHKARLEAEREAHEVWLGSLLRSAREEAGLTVEETIERAGLEPRGRFERRLRKLETGEYRFAMQDELEGLCGALDIRELRAFAALQKECEYYDDLDGRPTIVLRLVPAFYTTKTYPDHFTAADVLDFAREFSADKGLKVCVVMQDKRSVFIEQGAYHTETWEPPSMSIGGQNIGVLPPLPLTFVQVDEQE